MIARLGFNQQESDFYHGKNPLEGRGKSVMLAQSYSGSSAFGVPAGTPMDSSNPTPSPTVAAVKSIQSQVMEQINDLKAQARALRNGAASATSPTDAQAKLDQATRLDQQAAALQSAVGS
jgi:hypothetical protein